MKLTRLLPTLPPLVAENRSADPVPFQPAIWVNVALAPRVQLFGTPAVQKSRLELSSGFWTKRAPVKRAQLAGTSFSKPSKSVTYAARLRVNEDGNGPAPGTSVLFSCARSLSPMDQVSV
jgi:hypothetical protein